MAPVAFPWLRVEERSLPLASSTGDQGRGHHASDGPGRGGQRLDERLRGGARGRRAGKGHRRPQSRGAPGHAAAPIAASNVTRASVEVTFPFLNFEEKKVSSRRVSFERSRERASSRTHNGDLWDLPTHHSPSFPTYIGDCADTPREGPSCESREQRKKQSYTVVGRAGPSRWGRRRSCWWGSRSTPSATPSVWTTR